MHAEIESRSARRPSPPSRETPGLVAWLKVLDASLRLIEATVWEIRGAAEEAATWARQDVRRLIAGWGRAKTRASSEQDRLTRLTAAGVTLGKIAGSYRLHLTKAAFLSRERAARSLERLHATNARRFRELAERQGGGFLKVGQILSTRRDLLPDVFVDELTVLQDQAPRMPAGSAREAIERELGAPIDALFAAFDDEPCAAASVGQVHRATLADGREVAVKVRRPGIEETLALDLGLMSVFLRAMEGTLPPVDYETIEREIRDALMDEVDFALEASRIEEMAPQIAATAGGRAPAVVAERSSRGVLTTEWVSGRKLTDALDASAEKERAEIFERLVTSLARQILIGGAFHADPHPGNLFVDDDGRLVFIDFGCVGRVSPEARRQYVRLMQAFMVSDRDTVADALSALGFETRSGRPDTLLVFADALLGMLKSPVALEALSNPEDVTAEIRALLAAAEDDPVVKLPGEFILIARVFGTLGGLLVHYRPALEPTRFLFPVLAEAMAAAQPAAAPDMG